jgi:hypothetical protein
MSPGACGQIKQLIGELRSEMFLALTLDKFIDYVNVPELSITKDDVETCLKQDSRVKIINVGGKEVVWLWNDLQEFINRIIDIASIYGEAAIITEC